ncbi:MAG TPA: LamG-like jellyroll fold domain-containing protein [Verrucomicrobiae bacterium]|nr:LamG-like jellyroll fold domain-containing protein [Verrucomicrobiae bacterium]
MTRASVEAQTVQTNVAVIVQHAPHLDGRGVIQGSLQQLDGENVTLNGGFEMTGDLLVPGTPTVVTHGKASYAGTVPGDGSSSPSNYKIILDGHCSFNYLRTRTTPVTLPTVSPPPTPAGKRHVTINHRHQSYGDPDTLRDLTLAGDAGLIAVPPGTYGNFTVNGGSGLIIGVAGAVQPAIYNLQNLTLNSNARLKVVGPVALTVARGFSASGRVGNSKHPEWLQLNIASGDVTLNGGSIVYGLVTAPNGEVVICGNSTLVGTSASANFHLNDNGLVQWGGTVQVLLPPVATNQTVTLAENSPANITLTGFDPQNLPLTYSVLSEPANGVLSGTPPNLTYRPATNFSGDDSFNFDVNDGVTNSSPATISLVVTQVYYPPVAFSQALTTPENTALPVTLTGSDPQNYPLTYSIVTQPSHGTLSGKATNLVYQPAKNYFGSDAFTFEANDGVKYSAPATVGITIKAVDEPPLVSAGSNQLIILPNNTATLNGSVSYSEFPNTVDTVVWSKVSGPGTVAFGDASNPTTTANFSASGVYVLQLYASDSYLSASNTLKVTVDAPPVVNAGPETTNTFPGSITLRGTASDDGLPSGVLNLNWSEVSGPGTVIFSNPSATNSMATFSTNGIYDLRLTADDGVATNYSDVTVIENMPPAVNAGGNILTNGLAAMLNGSVSDDGLPGGYLAVQWVQSSGPGTAAFSESTSTDTAVSVDQSGVYVFTLNATDGAATNSSEVDVTFNLPPVATAGPEQTVNFGTVVTLAGTATDDHLPFNILDTVWSEVAGPGTATFAAASVTNTTVTFDQPGVYDLRLIADDGFATNSADVTIQVHAAPIVSAGNNQSGAVGSPLPLTGSFVDDGLAGPVTVQWTQISGPVAATITNPTATNTVVTCSQDGMYVFALTVTDGLTNGSAQVTIAAVAPPAVTVAAPSLLINWPVNQVVLNGTVTADGLPTGGTLTSTWSQVSGPAPATFVNPPAQTETMNGSPVSLPSSSIAMVSAPGIYVFQLAASNQGGGAQSNIVVTVNQPPAINAGVTQTNLFPAVAQLLGTVTDDGLPLGGKLTRSWSVVSGPGAVTFNNPALTNATATFSQSGLYVLQLTASDSAAVSSNRVVIIEDTAPSVQLSVNQLPGQTNQVTLTGTVTDDGLPPGAELTATWGEVSGSAPVVFNPPSQASVLSGVPVTNVVQSTATFSVAGTYVLSLTANDSFVVGNSATVSVSVPSTPVVVYAGPDQYLGGVPATTILNGQVTDAVLPLGATLGQQWSVLAGPGTVTFGNPTSPVTTATFSTNGIYELQLIGSNGQSQASSVVEVRVETICTVEDPEGLAAWWPANGNPEDVVSGLNAIIGGAGYTAGEVGQAFNFDGTDDSVRVPGATNYNVGASPSGLTIEFWMNPNSFQNGSVLGWANSIRVERESGNSFGSVLRCYLGSGGQYIQTPGNVWNNTNWAWTHVAVAYDAPSGAANLYINGAIAASAVVGTNLLSTTNDFYMGQVPGSANFYSGQLDEVSLYRRPLNPEEVYNIYASGSVGKCPDDTNAPLVVSAGPDLFLTGVPATGTLNGQVSDPVLPPGGTLSQQWNEISGPGSVVFGSPASPVTTATFSTNGIYVLELTAENGEQETNSLVEVRVETLCTVQDPEGLAAWWPADGSAQDVISGDCGILGGSTGYTAGEVGMAFNFDGADDFVWVPAAANYNVGASASGLTMEFWMKPNSLQNGSVLGWANSIRVERESGNWFGSMLRCYLGSGGQYIQTPGNVWNNTNWAWTHVAVAYDAPSGAANLYINGTIVASAIVGTNLLSTTKDFYMGQVPGSPNFYSGQLDEISLYRRPLNPEEVYNIYASGSVGKCPDTNTLEVYAGLSQAIPSSTNIAILSGAVTENGQPAGTDVQVQWSEYYGPGAVAFGAPTSVSSAAAFSTNGIYILQLSANNGDEESSGLVEVRVGVPCDDGDLSGLSAWWPGNGTAEDIISGNEAILGGGTGYTTGEVAAAFNFDGADDFVWAPAATNYNVGASSAGMTLEFWMKPNSLQNGGVLGWVNSIRVERESGNWLGSVLRCYLGSGGQYVQTPGNVWNSTSWSWTHVAVTCDRSTGVADMYINGSLAASANVGTSLMSTANDFYMGMAPGSAGFFSGQLDEISLYNRPLSAADVSAIYSAGSAGKCPQ